MTLKSVMQTRNNPLDRNTEKFSLHASMNVSTNEYPTQNTSNKIDEIKSSRGGSSGSVSSAAEPPSKNVKITVQDPTPKKGDDTSNQLA